MEAKLAAVYQSPMDAEVNSLNMSSGFGANLDHVFSAPDALLGLARKSSAYTAGLKKLTEARGSKATVLKTVRKLLAIIIADKHESA